MAESTTLLKLGFITNDNKTVVINVTDPASDLDDEAVSGAMGDMISSGVLSKTSGALKTKKYADLVTTEVTDIDLSGSI